MPIKGFKHITKRGVELKHCSRCKAWLPLSQYYPRTNKVDGYSCSCKECCRADSKRLYNSSKSRTLFSKWREKNKDNWASILDDMGFTKCSSCGYDKCSAAIDYHHVDPSQKEQQIARIFDKLPTEKRINELRKCIPLCSNCHREFHNGR